MSKRNRTKASRARRNPKQKSEDKNKKHIKNNGAFFNKDGRYKTGYFNSHKMGQRLQYRSAYELEFFKKMENSKDVLKYIVEPLRIPYIDSTGLRRDYIPDCLVLYSDGSMELCEVKPSNMLQAANVVRKARAAIKYLEEKNPNITYRFITEKDLFKSDKEYKKALKGA